MRYLLLLLLVLPTAAYADLPVAVAEGRVSLYDIFGEQIEFDRVYGGSLVTVDKFHHEIHERNAWVVSDIDSTLATNDTTAWVFQGGEIDAHVAIAINATLSGIVRLYELPTVVDSGVVLVPRNFDRHGTGSSDTSTMKWYQESNIGGGVIIDAALIGGGSAAARVGGGTRTNIEWIIPARTKYAVQFTALNNSTIVAFDAEWYEHEDDGSR